MTIVYTDADPVHYTVEGGGPPLVLVHGSTADAEGNYRHLRKYFTDRFRVITPNYAGSGGTPLPRGDLSLDLLVRQVLAAATAEVADGPFDVVGCSLGAVVSAAMAAECPHLVHRLVLVGGWVRNDDPRQRLALSLWRRLADLDADSYQRFTTLIGHAPGYLSAAGPEGVADLVRAKDCSGGGRRQIDFDIVVDIRDRVSSVAAPTLVIGASQDQLIPAEHARELHHAIPGSRYRELDGGHLLLVEKPAELARVINEFLSAGL
jgi:pimeloyl-ACP methyl ester carboxylesterase